MGALKYGNDLEAQRRGQAFQAELLPGPVLRHHRGAKHRQEEQQVNLCQNSKCVKGSRWGR